MKQCDAAKHFGVTAYSVNKWVKKYGQGGERLLKARKQGRPKGSSRLENWQAAVIVRTLMDRMPDQMKLPFMLWTREAVQMLIEQKTGVCYGLQHIGRLLRGWGFTPQKPVRKAWEQDPKAVEHWLREAYPAIRRRAKAEKAEIHWGDEMSMRSDHQAGRSWSLKGVTPAVEGTGKRFSCHMISTVTNRGTLRFMMFRERFTGPLFIRFLRRLLRSIDQKVFLILDSHPVHRSSKVKKWVAERSEHIELFFLPSYSPELNPDEYLNNDVKSNAVGRQRAATPDELQENVRSYLRSTQRQPKLVQKYFRALPVRYAMT
jgi:transposase